MDEPWEDIIPFGNSCTHPSKQRVTLTLRHSIRETNFSQQANSVAQKACSEADSTQEQKCES